MYHLSSDSVYKYKALAMSLNQQRGSVSAITNSAFYGVVVGVNVL